MKSKKRVECPSCGESFHLENWMRIGQQVLCPNCEEMLEVVNTNPLTLDFVFTNELAEFDGED